MTRDPRRLPEIALHSLVFDLLRVSAAPGTIFCHCQNGKIRDPRTAAKLSRMGVMPGVADIKIIPPKRYAEYQGILLRAHGEYSIGPA